MNNSTYNDPSILEFCPKIAKNINNSSRDASFYVALTEARVSD